MKQMNVYEFDELSEKAKKRAIKDFLDSDSDFSNDLLCEAANCFIDNLNEDFGVDFEKNCEWDLYQRWAKFTFDSNDDWKKFIEVTGTKERFKLLYDGGIFYLTLYRENHGSLESEIAFDESIYELEPEVYVEHEKKSNKVAEDFESYFRQWLSEKQREFVDSLQKDYEYFLSDEYAVEAIKDNENYFDIYGNKVTYSED